MIVNGIDISDCPFIDIMKRNKKLKKYIIQHLLTIL